MFPFPDSAAVLFLCHIHALRSVLSSSVLLWFSFIRCSASVQSYTSPLRRMSACSRSRLERPRGKSCQVRHAWVDACRFSTLPYCLSLVSPFSLTVCPRPHRRPGRRLHGFCYSPQRHGSRYVLPPHFHDQTMGHRDRKGNSCVPRP